MLKSKIINGLVVKVQAQLTREMGETAQTAQIVRQFTAELNSAEIHQFDTIVSKYIGASK